MGTRADRFRAKAPPGTVVYHCTPRENEAAIRNDGLRPGERIEPSGVYFFWRQERARAGRLPGEIMLEVNVSHLELLDDPATMMMAAGYTTDRIGPERIGRRIT